MKFKHIFIFCLLAILAGCSPQLKKPPTLPVPARPNVILILADDLGYETISSNGGESYKTPNIDKMAMSGMRFEHCYAQPQCTPSRVQLLTGIYNVRNYVDFGTLHTSQTTVAQLFRQAGYATGAVGKWQLGKAPGNANLLGFDDYLLWQTSARRVDSIGWTAERFPPENKREAGRDNRYSQPVLDRNGLVKTFDATDYGPEVINDYAMDFIERNSKGQQPFFLYYSMLLTHCPFSPTTDSPEWMLDDTTVMSYKGHPHYFEDMVSYMDKMVGNINAKLEELGIADNTLVIFTGDNGTDIPIVSRFMGRDIAGAKTQTTDAGTRVPLVAKWPGVVQAGTVNTDLVDFSDFLPTMLHAAGLEVPPTLGIDGQSFWPQLNGASGPKRKWVYCWYQHPARPQPRVFARNHRYKLYTTGEFYDVANDELEKNALPYEALGEEGKTAFAALESVLTLYSNRRLDAIPAGN